MVCEQTLRGEEKEIQLIVTWKAAMIYITSQQSTDVNNTKLSANTFLSYLMQTCKY